MLHTLLPNAFHTTLIVPEVSYMGWPQAILTDHTMAELDQLWYHETQVIVQRL